MFNDQIQRWHRGMHFSLSVLQLLHAEQEDAKEERGQHYQWQALWPRDKPAADCWQDYRAVLLYSLTHPSALWILCSTFLLWSEIRLPTINARKTSSFSENPEINLKSCSGLRTTHSRKQGITFFPPSQQFCQQNPGAECLQQKRIHLP